MKYFTYDHNGDGFEYHNTEEEAKKYAEESLDFYLQNDNHDFVDICWGEIKEDVHSNDAVLELKKLKKCKNKLINDWSKKMIVEILRDDEELGLKKGERYNAVYYPYDNEKITLLSRIGDGYDPECNQYIYDVAILHTTSETH